MVSRNMRDLFVAGCRLAVVVVERTNLLYKLSTNCTCTVCIGLNMLYSIYLITISDMYRIKVIEL
jgi:hypothetical protein